MTVQTGIGSIEYDHDGSGSEDSIYDDCLSTSGEVESQASLQTEVHRLPWYNNIELFAARGTETDTGPTCTGILLGRNGIESNDSKSGHPQLPNDTCDDSSSDSTVSMEVHQLPWYNNIERFAAQSTETDSGPGCIDVLPGRNGVESNDSKGGHLQVLDDTCDDISGDSTASMEVHQLPWYNNIERFAAQGTETDTGPGCIDILESNDSNLTSTVAYRVHWHTGAELHLAGDSSTAQFPGSVSLNQSSHRLLTSYSTLPPPRNRALLDLALSMISHQELRYQCMTLHLRDQNDISRKEADALSRLRGLITDEREERVESQRPPQGHNRPLNRELDVVEMLYHELVRLDKLQKIFEDAIDALERLRASVSLE